MNLHLTGTKGVGHKYSEIANSLNIIYCAMVMQRSMIIINIYVTEIYRNLYNAQVLVPVIKTINEKKLTLHGF